MSDDEIKQEVNLDSNFMNEMNGLTDKLTAELESIDSDVGRDKHGFKTWIYNIYVVIEDFIRKHFMELVISALYLAMFMLLGKQVMDFGMSIYILDIKRLGLNQVIVPLLVLAPMFIWLLSTNTTFYNFRSQKAISLRFVYLFTSFQFLRIVLYIVFIIAMPAMAKLEIRDDVTVEMIVGMCYSILVGPLILISLASFAIWANFKKDDTYESLMKYRLTHSFAYKPKNKYEYVYAFVRDMKTGKKVYVSEHDRYLPSAAIGSTGTGKTSMSFKVPIYRDLLTKYHNTIKQERFIEKHLKLGNVYPNRNVEDNYFNIEYYSPTEKFEKKFNSFKKKYRSCGILAQGPDDSLPDDIYEMAKMFNFKCNRIDPRRVDGKMKEGAKGYNPLFVSPLLSEFDQRRDMVKKAILLSDALELMNTMKGGKSDPYFSSVNKAATITTALTLALTYPRLNGGKQPNPGTVLNIMNDFSRIMPYYTELKKIDVNNEYATVRDTIENYFLPTGAGAQKFAEHCNGVKIQLSNFLLDKQIGSVLNTDDSVDLDKMLAEGEITVFNMELGELGSENSSAFGLLFTVNMINAILRRPGTERTRLPFFWFLDEFPIVMNNSMEACFTLFRKFRASMFIALQSLAQMDKTSEMKYFKGVMVNNCAHMLIFGRAAKEEMDMFSELSGTKRDYTPQQTISQTSITLDNPTYSESERVKPEDVVHTPGEDFRYREFSEGTFFTTKRGTPMRPIHGKLDFLPKKVFKKKYPRSQNDWTTKIVYPAKATAQSDGTYDIKVDTKKADVQNQDKIDTSIESISTIKINTSVIKPHNNNDTADNKASSIIINLGNPIKEEVESKPKPKEENANIDLNIDDGEQGFSLDLNFEEEKVVKTTPPEKAKEPLEYSSGGKGDKKNVSKDNDKDLLVFSEDKPPSSKESIKANTETKPKEQDKEVVTVEIGDWL